MNANETQIKTRQDVDALKANWLSDPCWDIEDTEGYEAYREELRLFSIEVHLRWAQHKHAFETRYATEHACSIEVAHTLMVLQDAIKTLRERLDKLENA